MSFDGARQLAKDIIDVIAEDELRELRGLHGETAKVLPFERGV